MGVLLLGRAGLAAVLAPVLLYDRDTPFPGAAALLPVLGTAAVLLAGPSDRVVGGLLGSRPLRAAGRLSYAWYVWHWPVLTIAQARFGALPWTTLVALTAASTLPA